jgi:hypothetical protein
LEKKKLIELLAAVFIAVIFVSSYAAFGNSGGIAKTSTTTIPGTIQIHGSAQGSIVSYGDVLDVNVSCANASAVSGSLSGYLAALEKNGSIDNFYSPADNEVLVQTGNYSLLKAYGAIAAKLGRNANCTGFAATQATVQIPSAINATYEGGAAKIPIPNALRNYTRQVALSKGMSNSIGVSVYALVTQNGTIFNNQIIVSLQAS